MCCRVCTEQIQFPHTPFYAELTEAGTRAEQRRRASVSGSRCREAVRTRRAFARDFCDVSAFGADDVYVGRQARGRRHLKQ